MEKAAQDRRSQSVDEATANELFDAVDIDSSSTELARPLAIGCGRVTIDGRSEEFDYELRPATDGATTVEINGASWDLSPTGRLFSGIGAVVSAYLKKLAIAAPAAAAGLGFIGVTENADATLMRDGASESSYRQIGADHSGEAIWFKADFRFVNGDITPFFGSAVRLNSQYGLTAAHNLFSSNGTITLNSVGVGSNYLTDPGSSAGVANILINPSYDGTRNTPDIAIIRFSDPLPGQDLEIASWPSGGAILTGVGFGTYGTPSSGLHAQDGSSRGWVAPVDTSLLIDASSTYYLSTFFGSSTQLSMNGKATGGDSGGPLFDSVGHLVGINIAQSGGTDTVGTTISLVLAQREVNSWISQNTIVPEPSAFVLMLLGAGGIGIAARATEFKRPD